MKSCLKAWGYVSIAFFFSGFKTINNPVAHSLILNDTLPCFLAISDIHLWHGGIQSSIGNKAGDSGEDLWKYAKDEIKWVIAERHPQFIIVLGDLPAHSESDDFRKESIRQAIADLHALADTNKIPLLYVPGNNDSYEEDYAPFSSKIFEGDLSWPVVNGINTPTPAVGVPGSDSLFDSLGCYSVYPLGNEIKLRMIVLNTVVFTRNGTYAYSTIPGKQDADASREIKWFRHQLKEADSLAEHIMVAMHIPPGIDGYKKKKNNKDSMFWYDSSIQNSFLRGIDSFQRSRHSFVSLLASHTHMDGIRVLRDSSYNTISMLLSVPAIAPGHGNNPAIKVIEYDPQDSFAVTDFTTYYMDVNGDSTTAVPWGKSFSFRERFNCTTPDGPLVKYFQDSNTKNADCLKQFVNGIYGAPGKKDSNEVNATIYVDYRK